MDKKRKILYDLQIHEIPLDTVFSVGLMFEENKRHLVRLDFGPNIRHTNNIGTEQETEIIGPMPISIAIAAFKYMKFLVSKSSQLKWATATGYVPVNEDALKDPKYTKSTSVKSPAIVGDAMKHVYTIPATKNSEYTFRDTSAIMENILSQVKKKSLKSLIQQGKNQFDKDWNQ